MMPKAFVSWSSGKDSAFALYEARRQGLAEIAGVLTTVNEKYDRVAMHGVRHALLDRQIEALGLAPIKIMIPSPCPNAIYEARMAQACDSIKSQGIHHIVFGDLFLQDIRTYREEKLAIAQMGALFPLWKRDTAMLAERMIEEGFEAYLVCIDTKKLNPSFAGRRFDQSLLRDLPANVDPCGENGEFHTVVVDGPIFNKRISVEVGQVVEREGFVFADVLPVDS